MDKPQIKNFYDSIVDDIKLIDYKHHDPIKMGGICLMLSIIVAKASNNVIGGNNDLLWRIPQDLKRFKEITTGHTIIMGRKTFESLPRVLPNRKHIVITRDKNFKVDSDMVHIVNDISSFLF